MHEALMNLLKLLILSLSSVTTVDLSLARNVHG